MVAALAMPDDLVEKPALLADLAHGPRVPSYAHVPLVPIHIPVVACVPLVSKPCDVHGRGRGDYHRPGASFHTVRDWPAGGVVRVRFHAKPALAPAIVARGSGALATVRPVERAAKAHAEKLVLRGCTRSRHVYRPIVDGTFGSSVHVARGQSEEILVCYASSAIVSLVEPLLALVPFDLVWISDKVDVFVKARERRQDRALPNEESRRGAATPVARCEIHFVPVARAANALLLQLAKIACAVAMTRRAHKP